MDKFAEIITDTLGRAKAMHVDLRVSTFVSKARFLKKRLN